MRNLIAPSNTSETLESQNSSNFDDTYSIFITGKKTNKSLSIIDKLHSDTGPEANGNFNEIFYVIDGEVEVKSEVFDYVAKKGSYVIITQGEIVLSFKNSTSKKASLLWL